VLGGLFDSDYTVSSAASFDSAIRWGGGVGLVPC